MGLKTTQRKKRHKGGRIRRKKTERGKIRGKKKKMKIRKNALKSRHKSVENLEKNPEKIYGKEGTCIVFLNLSREKNFTFNEKETKLRRCFFFHLKQTSTLLKLSNAKGPIVSISFFRNMISIP